MSQWVLVIEDDPRGQVELRQLLTSLGYQVVIATEALEGLGIAYTAKPDLIILDAILYGMDAAETCQCFREISAVPILILTRLGLERTGMKALTMGADAYLVKPVTRAELGTRINALLRRALPQAEARPSK